jgi:hypothetical protein
MWIPRTPDEVASWRKATSRESLANARLVGVLLWLAISAMAAAGLVVSRNAAFAIGKGNAGGFWIRFGYSAALSFPFVCFGLWRVYRSDMAKEERRTVCPRCDTTGTGNAGSSCACGSAFVPCSSVRWVEDVAQMEAQPDGPANGGQPLSPGSTSPSSASGPRR